MKHLPKNWCYAPRSSVKPLWINRDQPIRIRQSCKFPLVMGIQPCCLLPRKSTLPNRSPRRRNFLQSPIRQPRPRLIRREMVHQDYPAAVAADPARLIHRPSKTQLRTAAGEALGHAPRWDFMRWWSCWRHSSLFVFLSFSVCLIPRKSFLPMKRLLRNRWLR